MRAQCKKCGAVLPLDELVFVPGTRQNDRGHYECRGQCPQKKQAFFMLLQVIGLYLIPDHFYFIQSNIYKNTETEYCIYEGEPCISSEYPGFGFT